MELISLRVHLVEIQILVETFQIQIFWRNVLDGESKSLRGIVWLVGWKILFQNKLSFIKKII